jgi:hypothetical protein
MESTVAGGAAHAQQAMTATAPGTAYITTAEAQHYTTVYAETTDVEQANLQRRLKGCSSSGASNVPWSHQKVLVQTKPHPDGGSSSTTAARSTVSWEVKPRYATLENSKHILRRREARRIEQDNARMQQKLTAIYQSKHTGKPFAAQDCSKEWQQRTAVYDQAARPGTATLVPRSTLRRSTSTSSGTSGSLKRSSSCGSRAPVMRSSSSGGSGGSHGITKTLAFAACAGVCTAPPPHTHTVSQSLLQRFQAASRRLRPAACVVSHEPPPSCAACMHASNRHHQSAHHTCFMCALQCYVTYNRHASRHRHQSVLNCYTC